MDNDNAFGGELDQPGKNLNWERVNLSRRGNIMKQSGHDEMDLVKLKATMREYGCNYFGTHYPDYEGLYKIFIDLALHTMIRLIYRDNTMIDLKKKLE